MECCQAKTDAKLGNEPKLEAGNISGIALYFDDVVVELFVDTFVFEPLEEVEAGGGEHEVDDDGDGVEEGDASHALVHVCIKQGLQE